jgi:hypothetical protein
MKYLSILLALTFLLYPFSAFAAAWTATETFETYSVAALNGDNGGAGWSGAWAASSGDTVVSSPVFAGTRAYKLVAGTGDANRSLTTGVTSGIVRFYFMGDGVPGAGTNGVAFHFRESGTVRFKMEWGGATPGNNVDLVGGTSIVIASGISANTWYYIDTQFDQANNRARMSFNGGSWSAYVTAIGGSFTTINGIRTADINGGTENYYYDNIGVGTGPLATFQLWPFSLF